MNLPEVAIIRGFFLNNFEMQNYSPLHDRRYRFTGLATEDHLFETDLIGFPVVTLKSPRRVPARKIPLLRRYVARFQEEKRGEYDYFPEELEKAVAGQQIIHAAETMTGFSLQAARLAQALSLPLVLTIWENIPFCRDEEPGIPERRAFIQKIAFRYFAITERAKAALLVEGVPEEKIRVIGCGVDIEHFRPAERDTTLLKRLQLEPDDFVILCACQLLTSKGLPELLSALALLHRDQKLIVSGRRVKVTIIGEGKDRALLTERCNRLGLSDIVSFPGKISYTQMPEVHNLADIFVLPSIPTPTWQEQFGMVLAESMATGKPVLSTLSGSIPDVVGEAALLVQSADPLALADGLSRLIADAELRQKMGERSLAHARATFDSRRVASCIGDCYDELLADWKGQKK